MILSIYMQMLLLMALISFDVSIPVWLDFALILGIIACYWIAEIRYSQLKKRIKELEESNADNWKTWNHQVKINTNVNEFMKKLVMEDDGK